MLKNFLTETDLQAYAPNLDGILWTDQADYSAQIEKAFLEVRDDFFTMGLRSVFLRPDACLFDGTTSDTATKISEAVTDQLSRNRWVVNCTAISGTAKTLTLQGSNDNVTYYTVDSQSISATGLTSYVIDKNYLYYKLTATVASGAITLESYLTETVFDTLFAYKTLELIFQSLVKAEGDQWSIKRDYFGKNYREKLSTYKYHYDSDNDGVVDVSETIKMNLITYYR